MVVLIDVRYKIDTLSNVLLAIRIFVLHLQGQNVRILETESSPANRIEYSV